MNRHKLSIYEYGTALHLKIEIHEARIRETQQQAGRPILTSIKFAVNWQRVLITCWLEVRACNRWIFERPPEV